jgi:hypothetical protein
MKHLEPSQQPMSREARGPAGALRNSGWKLLTAGLALVIGMGYGMTTLWNPAPGDAISDTDKSELVAAFSKLESVRVEQVSDKDVEAALDTMRLAPDRRQALRKSLAATDPASHIGAANTQPDNSELVWVVLWDFASADGDIVSVSTAGYQVDIPLQKAQTRIALPVDATRIVKVTGKRDGGGGITLGVQSDTSAVSLPVLQVGQTLSLPVSF